ncbi:GNAT family N-acetyltransferase [Flindersiella endophytica]
MVLRVREARVGDARRVAEVHIAAWQAGYAGQLPADFLAGLSDDMEARAERRRERLELAANPCLIAVDDEAGELYGFTEFGAYRSGGDGDTVPETTGELYVINLRPDAWGKGIAASLFQAGIDGLRAMGYHDAVLWVLETNTRARRFYEKHGWKPDGQAKTDHNGTVELREIRYAMPLG